MDSLRVSIATRLRSFVLDVDVEVGAETLALVGPSGAGKSTILRAIAGLVRPDRGVVALGPTTWFDSARKIDSPPERRAVGLVFQDYALFPHLTVAQNVGYGGRARADALLAAFGLEALRHERPASLSGGERQRVALARALARGPAVLLLDEPLAALDTLTRATVRADLRARLRSARMPTLVVTHDYEDAFALADRVGVLVDGRIVQLGTPAELVAAPANEFVATFVGANFVEGVARGRTDGLTEIALGDGVTVVSTHAGSGRVGVVVAPWDVVVSRERPDDSMQNHLHARIEAIVPFANRARVRIGPLTAEVTHASLERLDLAEGDHAYASFKATAARLVPLD